MATCVVLQADGTLMPTGQSVGECSGYVLVSGSEYSVYALVQEAFAMPSKEDAIEWSTGCCVVVIVWFVLGRMAGSVAGMFNDR
ncbi:hypothetical protein [Xanthomonas arboricola]|uniref:Uncharacterized protein n=4 Tax=Xanthomonas arboricola pv. pruni TaxID=69929 RepID=A0AAP4KDN9_9XANT|nr:hypothetical protein [Xanthomonas arboricola]GAE48707.1 minor coat protein [Xanthomonas arboricola pv. pruni str. MAFF 311562]GAE58186.1 hypothetical protein XPN_0092 [Xanthomonas arboricola pv. pruni MAFF 301427]KCW98180.1 hypothetical protein DK27_13915 [Xanthomonas arboricola pv. pruni]KPN12402.1 hypothetical protein AN652_00680 [Xanthomonas arboricola pv. pruni]MDN0267931.1 hypothetical protein [Xanthomonas arboricola pv. pruni]